MEATVTIYIKKLNDIETNFLSIRQTAIDAWFVQLYFSVQTAKSFAIITRMQKRLHTVQSMCRC